MLKQESDYFEHFYGQLERWTHYVPVKKDLSDLVERIRWALQHDEEAERIAKNARDFARRHLMPREIVCYHALVLREWTERLKFEPEVKEGMEEVVNEDERNFFCRCQGVEKEEL